MSNWFDPYSSHVETPSQWFDEDIAEPAGGGVTANGSATLAALALVATALVGVSGAAARTLSPLTPSASATVAVQVSGAPTLPAITRSSGASVAVSGAGASTMPAMIRAAAGDVAVGASSASTLPPVARAAQAAVAVSAGASSTLPAMSQSASAEVQADGVTANGAATMPTMEREATGTADVSSSSDSTLPTLAASGEGVVILPAIGDVVLPAPGTSAVAVTFTGTMPEAQTVPVPVGYRLIPVTPPPHVEPEPVTARELPAIPDRILPPPANRPQPEALPAMSKTAGEVKGFCVSWSALGEEIASSAFTSEVGVLADLFTGSACCVWFEGGEPGTYRVSNTITTASGLTGTRAFLLQVEA